MVINYFQLIQIFHEKTSFYQSQSYGLYLCISMQLLFIPTVHENQYCQRIVPTSILANVCGQCIFLFRSSTNLRRTFDSIFSNAFLLLHLVPTRHICKISVLSDSSSKAQLCNEDLYRSERSSSGSYRELLTTLFWSPCKNYTKSAYVLLFSSAKFVVLSVNVHSPWLYSYSAFSRKKTHTQKTYSHKLQCSLYHEKCIFLWNTSDAKHNFTW